MKLSKIYMSLFRQLREKGEVPEQTFLRRSDILPCVFFQGMDIGILSVEAMQFISTLEVPDLPDSTDIGGDMLIDISRAKITGQVELTSGDEIILLRYNLIAISQKLALLEMKKPKEGIIPGSFVDGSRMYMVTSLDSLTDNLSAFRFLFWFFENYEKFDFAKKPIEEEGREWGTILPTGRSKKVSDDIIPLEWLVTGHFRLQPYGKGRQNHKLKFIGPQKRKRHLPE